MCGQQSAAAADIIAALQFSGFPATSRTPAHLRALLRRWSEAERKRFLVFVTAQSALPSHGAKVKIARHGRTSDYPTAHTCFNRLDLPDYGDDKEALRTRLQFCIDNIELAGFGIA